MSEKPWYAEKGYVCGGFYDEFGGMVVGVRAQEIADRLNRISALEEVLDGIHHVHLTASDEIDRDIGVSRILDAHYLKEQGNEP